MVEIKSGGDGTLSLAPSLLLSASPRAHHVAPCPIVSLWWSLICICAGTHLATGSLGAGVPLTARVPDGLSVASIHLPQAAPWENSELFLPDLSWAHAFISWCLWPSPLFLNATLRVLPSRLPSNRFFVWRISAHIWISFVTFREGSNGPRRKLRWTKMGQRQKHRGESGAEVWLSESTMDGSGPGCTLLNKFKRHKQRLFSQNYSEVWFWV